MRTRWRIGADGRNNEGNKTTSSSEKLGFEVATLEIRDAIEADLPAIVGIYNARVPSRMVTADPDPVPFESRPKWFRGDDPNRHPLWVAEADGEVAGWFSFEPFRERPAYRATAEVSVYVAEGQRRKGIGRRLLAEAIRRAPGFGFKTLTAGAFCHKTARASNCSRVSASSAGPSTRGWRSQTASSATSSSSVSNSTKEEHERSGGRSPISEPTG